MSRTRRVIGATSIGYLHQVATIIVGLWLTPFLLRYLGQRDLGLWLVVGQVLGYLSLVDLGVLAILPREVAYLSAQQNTRSRVAPLVRHVQRIVRRQVVGLTAICLTGFVLMGSEWSGVRWPLACVVIVFIAAYPLRIPSAVLQGLQQLPFLARTQLIGWALGTSVTVGLVAFGLGLWALVAGWSVTLLLPALAGAWRYQQLRVGVEPDSEHTTDRDYFGRSVWVSAGQIGQVFLSGSDVLVIGRLLGAAAVVPYACTAKLVTMFTNYPQLLLHAAQPALTELRGSASRDRLVRVAQALMQGVLIFSGALVVFVLAVNPFFVNWWVGPAQYAGIALTLAMTSMMLLRHWNVATIYTLFCFGYERQLSLIALADGIVTVLATVWLVPKLGMVGAPIASALGAVLVALPFNIRSAAAEMNLGIVGFLRPCLTLAGAISVAVALAAYGSLWLDPSRLFPTVAFALIALTVYGAVVAPFIVLGPLKPYAVTALSMVAARQPRDQTAVA